jgi:hypothetical protein
MKIPIEHTSCGLDRLTRIALPEIVRRSLTLSREPAHDREAEGSLIALQLLLAMATQTKSRGGRVKMDSGKMDDGKMTLNRPCKSASGGQPTVHRGAV